jgi:peptide/nickel transport system substrate-binding protein
MLTDVVSDSSYTFTKNQGYWANDPRHPENRLPYIDVIETLIIPDEATRLAGLRSGKVTSITTVSQPLADGLMRTNPDLKYKSYRWDGDSMSFNMTLPFWQDIRIRKAMQLALDNDAVVENYYKGFANPTPFGVVGPAVVGFHIPFDEWPADLQAEYGYDPVEAERLLDEAGLPRGADGIRFKTKYDVAPAWIGMDVDHAQLTKAYYAAVGIDLEINVLERGPFLERVFAHTYEGLTWARRGRDYVPAYYLRIMAGCGQRWNFPGTCDPVFDAILDKADKATTLDEYKKHTIEADMYYIRQHWTIMAPYRNVFTFWQPWLGGFSGERNLFNSASAQGQFTRTWVEIDMKAKMGH